MSICMTMELLEHSQVKEHIAESLSGDLEFSSMAVVCLGLVAAWSRGRNILEKYWFKKMNTSLIRYTQKWQNLLGLFLGNHGFHFLTLTESFLSLGQIIAEEKSYRYKHPISLILQMSLQELLAEINWFTVRKEWCLKKELELMCNFLVQVKQKDFQLFFCVRVPQEPLLATNLHLQKLLAHL